MSSTAQPSTTPLVSCIVTNYNYAQFIEQAIDSLLQQTYPNLEIIVVDDGSGDDSINKLKKYKAKIKLITQSNQGVVVARNNGAKHANGTYIFFLDADDYLDSSYVAQLVQVITTSPQPNIAFAYCDFHLIGQAQGIIKSCAWNPRKLLYRNYIIVAAVIKKQAFDQVGGFDLAVNQQASFEDWDLWLSLLEHGYQGVYCPQALHYYRIHHNGRNQAALRQRADLEHILHQKHPKLYNQPFNKLYLAIFRNASRLRNAIQPPPGT